MLGDEYPSYYIEALEACLAGLLPVFVKHEDHIDFAAIRLNLNSATIRHMVENQSIRGRLCIAATKRVVEAVEAND